MMVRSIADNYPNVNLLHNNSLNNVSAISSQLGIEPAVAKKDAGSQQFAYESIKSITSGNNFSAGA